jgi:hypothetical protein
MQPLRRAGDRVDRARLDAFRAADAQLRDDPRDPSRGLGAAGGVEPDDRASGRCGEQRDAGDAARRAAIDRRAVADDRGRIGQAAAVAAFRALRLRQQRVDRVDARLGRVVRRGGGWREAGRRGVAQACSRTKARILGQMISRQRRPLKIP